MKIYTRLVGTAKKILLSWYLILIAYKYSNEPKLQIYQLKIENMFKDKNILYNMKMYSFLKKK